MKKQQKKKIFCKQNIPNMLVVFRMILAIVVVALLIADHFTRTQGCNPVLYKLQSPKSWMPVYYVSGITLFHLLSGCFFVIASISDWLDGFLARRNNWVSDFGKFWDPVADKVLINSTLICFACSGLIPIFVPILMIARDVIVDAQRMVAAKKNIVVAANFWGKLKTVLQMVGIIVIFFFFAYPSSEIGGNVIWWTLQNILIFCATIVSIVSGIIYFRDIHKAINHASKN